MSTPLVSIIVNNFNYARFLKQSISSALSQTHPRTEVIVVDDASSDESWDIIRGYGSRVIAVLQERNRGQGAAFNAGVAASRGEIVLFLDADDYLHPHAVATVAAAWRPGLSKVQFRLDLVDVDGRNIGLFPAPEIRFESGDVVSRLLAMGRYETTVTSGNAFSREVLEQVLPVPEADFRISADGYLVTVVPFHGLVASIDEPLGAYRLHGANAWAQGSLGFEERLRRSLEHDALKYRELRAKAGQLGLVASPSLGMGDPHHLSTRLASLVLEPARHPYEDDTRVALALRGALASKEGSLGTARKTLLASWFLLVGVLPRPLARRAIWWRLSPGSRPAGVARLLRAIRRSVYPPPSRPPNGTFS